MSRDMWVERWMDMEEASKLMLVDMGSGCVNRFLSECWGRRDLECL